MILSEKMINTKYYAGCIDILTGFDDFETELEFNQETHTYTLNKEPIPSVTQLLDDGSYNNINISEDVLKYAREKGTLIHKEIENYLKYGLDGFTEEFYEFKQLYKENIEKFTQKAIFDIKTYASNDKSKRKKCYIQELMYAKGVEHLTNKKVEHFYEIWLPHNKKGRLIDLGEEFSKSWEEFEHKHFNEVGEYIEEDDD